jgi:hypothetical protein
VLSYSLCYPFFLWPVQVLVFSTEAFDSDLFVFEREVEEGIAAVLGLP